MATIRYWVVEQTRRVRVRADTPADAVRVGNAAFKGEKHDFQDIGGQVTHGVRETDISATEDI